MVDDLEERFNRVVENVLDENRNERTQGVKRSRALVQVIKKTKGLDILLQVHIRNLAYVLGLNNTADDSSSLICSQRFKEKIQPYIPLEYIKKLDDLLTPSDSRRYKTIMNEAYLVEGAKRAMEELGSQNKLKYSGQRFERALKLIRTL